MFSKQYPLIIYTLFYLLNLLNCQNTTDTTNPLITPGPPSWINQLNYADIAWMIVASVLVMIMTPALGFFYGGLVKTKNMLSMLGQCFAIYALTAAIWTLIGFSIVFSKTSNTGLIGGLDNGALVDTDYAPVNLLGATIPFFLFYFFQMQFACITPALIIGATAERLRFKPLIIFCAIWHILVYCPVAHWNWNPNGWLALLGVKDFAGGNVIHISAGISGLALVLFLENEPIKKKDKEISNKQNEEEVHLVKKVQEEETMSISFSKNSLVFMVIGTMLLWFGWFGFNAGSALQANNRAVLAAVNTNVAPAISLLSWLILDLITKGRPTVSGMCIGVVCGLVGITPAAGFVRVWAGVVIGIFSAVIPYVFCYYRDKYKFFDDRLDVFGCHAVGGIVGGFFLGLFYCEIKLDNTCDPTLGLGAVYGDGYQLGYQIIGIVATVAYSFITTYIIIFILSKVMNIATFDNAIEGVDKMDFKEYALPGSPVVKKKKGLINNEE